MMGIARARRARPQGLLPVATALALCVTLLALTAFLLPMFGGEGGEVDRDALPFARNGAPLDFDVPFFRVHEGVVYGEMGTPVVELDAPDFAAQIIAVVQRVTELRRLIGAPAPDGRHVELVIAPDVSYGHVRKLLSALRAAGYDQPGLVIARSLL